MNIYKSAEAELEGEAFTPSETKSTVKQLANKIEKEDVVKFLSNIKLEKYSQLFLENNVDGSLLFSLTAEDLQDLGVENKFHQKKIVLKFREYLEGK